MVRDGDLYENGGDGSGERGEGVHSDRGGETVGLGSVNLTRVGDSHLNFFVT